MQRTVFASAKKRLWPAGMVLLAAVVAVLAWVSRMNASRTPRVLRLPDRTEAFFLTDTRVEPAPAYPHSREIRVDGDVFIRTPAAAAPLIVRTRLLVLTVSGDSALRITGYSKQTGEQVEVLHGHVEARKSYPSNDSTPDMLIDGEMSMINRTIDLMEKETFDTATLRVWSEQLMAAATSSPPT